MTLDDIVKKLRKVKYGDYVLADDHNDLVDALTLISKNIKVTQFYSGTEYSIYNDARERNFCIFQSIYSEKIGRAKTRYIFHYLSLVSMVWTSVKNQESYIELCYHEKDHPSGEIISGISMYPDYLPDCLWTNWRVGIETTPLKVDMSGHGDMDLRSPEPRDIYAVIWIGATAKTKDVPFIAYAKDIDFHDIMMGSFE
jgi:hypothetical protein